MNKQLIDIIYKLIYPAFLGSMLYDIVPFGSGIIYFVQVFILIFYLLDYYHLYFIMDEKFEDDEKTTWQYVLFDLAVSFALLIGFKYSGLIEETVSKSIILTAILSISLVSCFFLGYSLKLNYTTKYYRNFVAFCSIFGAVLLIVFFFQTFTLFKWLLLAYTALMVIIYSLIVNRHRLAWNEERMENKKVPNTVENDNGS